MRLHKIGPCNSSRELSIFGIVEDAGTKEWANGRHSVTHGVILKAGGQDSLDVLRFRSIDYMTAQRCGLIGIACSFVPSLNELKEPMFPEGLHGLFLEAAALWWGDFAQFYWGFCTTDLMKFPCREPSFKPSKRIPNGTWNNESK